MLNVEIFPEICDLKDVEIINLNFYKELDELQLQKKLKHEKYSLDGERCYCIKLVQIATSLFGKSMIETGIGSKMKSVYFNNFKNVINCYNEWKDLSPDNICDIRKGKGVKAGEIYKEE